MNYFEFYGLPVTYFLDAAALKKKFLEKSRAVHPDMHSQTTANEQSEALRLSAFNNDAFKTLNNPTLRLAYLFRLFGLMDAAGQTQMKLDSGFLMEMLDLNDAVTEWKAAKDKGEDPASVVNNDIEQQVKTKQDDLEAALDTIMRAFDAAKPDEKESHLKNALKLYLEQKIFMISPLYYSTTLILKAILFLIIIMIYLKMTETCLLLPHAF